MKPGKIVLFANTDWYLYNFRLSLARRLRDEGNDLLLLSPPGEYGNRLRAMGFRWETVPMDRRSLNPVGEARLVLHLARLFRREKPILVHGLTIKPAIYGSLAARLAGVPGRVNAVNGLGYVFSSTDVLARVLRPVVRTMMRFAFGGKKARLVVQNADDKALFERAKLIAPKYVRLIPGSGVDCSRFSIGSRRRNPSEPLRVLFAARLLWDKGIREFVEAARLLGARNMRFLIAGESDPGNPAAVPADTIAACQNAGLVQWLGHVDDMPGLMASVDVVALPSYYREGLPRVLIEAAACALPVVTTDMPGCREVVTDGVDGLLVPARDAGALARALVRIDDDPELAAQLGRAAREKVLREFDERIIIERTLDVYAEVV